MQSKLIRYGLIVAGLALAVFVWKYYREPRFITGEQAPDFQTTLLDGRQVRLSDLKGKYVLLQFWGSWCGPCRAENPHLVELYHKLHPGGTFEIFSIGIERNERNWQRAIQQDGMAWNYHCSDLKEFDGEIARLFNIRQIPTTFLINPEGRIIGVNPDPEKIEKAVSAAVSSH